MKWILQNVEVKSGPQHRANYSRPRPADTNAQMHFFLYSEFLTASGVDYANLLVWSSFETQTFQQTMSYNKISETELSHTHEAPVLSEE